MADTALTVIPHGSVTNALIEAHFGLTYLMRVLTRKTSTADVQLPTQDLREHLDELRDQLDLLKHILDTRPSV